MCNLANKMLVQELHRHCDPMTGYADYKLSTPVAKVYNALHPPSAAQPHRPVTPTPDQVTHVTHVTIGGD